MPSPEYIRSHSPEGARNRLIAENLRYLEEKRLKLEDLREVYSEEEVRRDAASVRERENRFAHSREGETGKMAEALFHKTPLGSVVRSDVLGTNGAFIAHSRV